MRTRALVAGLTLAGCVGLTTVSPALLPAASAATPWPGHPNRELVSYTVRSGDTLTGLAVRFHAWTAELASVNHLSTRSQLRVGEHLRIPVVVSGHRAPALTREQRRQAATRARVAKAVAAVKARYTYKHATRWRGHPDRILVPHVVRRGETIYGIAVAYHAWTRELRSLNHVTSLPVGKHIRIPIVVSVMHRAEAAAIKRAASAAKAGITHKHARKASKQSSREAMIDAGWRDWTMSRSQVRSLIVHTARRNGLSPRLALAIAWQESGWHQPLVSSSGAIGVMQLLPGTAQWMGLYAGRSLNPRSTHDNVLAGVLFLKYLTKLAGPRHRSQVIAAYYQGMSAIGRKPKWFNDTLQYVKSVTAIYNRL
jgi:LysM repeat protein